LAVGLFFVLTLFFYFAIQTALIQYKQGTPSTSCRYSLYSLAAMKFNSVIIGAVALLSSGTLAASNDNGYSSNMPKVLGKGTKGLLNEIFSEVMQQRGKRRLSLERVLNAKVTVLMVEQKPFSSSRH
jgi:hypothetical protein